MDILKRYISVKMVKVAILLFFICTFSLQANNEEYILNFHSDIRLDVNGRVDVTETIKIKVTGESIKKGIVRSIPFYRKNKYNIDKRIDVNVESVLKDGKEEDFFTEKEGRNFAIFIGNKSVTLSPAVYEYTIKYWTRGHVGFFDNYDEIYWNVNGNEWEFDIDSVSATVHLPQGAKLINNSCYTGREGSRSSKCFYKSVGDSIVQFYGKYNFARTEGLTIATSFTPNIIKRPFFSDEFVEFLYLYGLPIMCVLGILIMIVSFFVSKKKINTMNGVRIVTPQFSSPDGESPANLRFLLKKKFDNKTFTACLISMAVKKAIQIKKRKDIYTLVALNDTSGLSDEELDVYQKLFSISDKVVLESFKKVAPLKKALNALETILPINNKLDDYIVPRDRYLTQFVLLSYFVIALWFIACYTLVNIPLAKIFAVVASSIWLVLLLPKVKNSLASCFVGLAVPFILFFQLFLLFGDTFFAYSIALIWSLGIIDLLAFKYFKPLTAKGVTFYSELEGFKMYLSVAEEHRLNVLNPPELTLELFDKMLPYAVALDLEIKWAKKFEKTLSAIDYHPTWYDGTTNISFVDFTKTLSKSLSSDVESSIQSPPSKGGGRSGGSSSSDWSSGSSSSGSSSWSSGSSGGGSSGGGGGGGGGRGW